MSNKIFKSVPKPLPLIERGVALTADGRKVSAVKLTWGAMRDSSHGKVTAVVLEAEDAVKMAKEVLRTAGAAQDVQALRSQ
jgi:hypothetical protein